jgi:hypothetical protein
VLQAFAAGRSQRHDCDHALAVDTVAARGAEQLRSRRRCCRGSWPFPDTMGHDDVGKGLAEGRHDAVDKPAATGRRLMRPRRARYRCERKPITPGGRRYCRTRLLWDTMGSRARPEASTTPSTVDSYPSRFIWGTRSWRLLCSANRSR